MFSEEYSLLQAVYLLYVPNEAQSTVLRLRTQCSLCFMLSGRVTAFLKLNVVAERKVLLCCEGGLLRSSTALNSTLEGVRVI